MAAPGKLAIVAAVGLMSGFVAIGQESQPASHDESLWFRNVRQLTSVDMGLTRSGEAYFSPDMKRISFQAFPVGKDDYQIYVMNLDGTGLKMVSTGVGATTCSHFHPSGEKLIFAANHDDLRPPTKPHELEPMRPRGEGAAGRSPAHGGGHSGGPPEGKPGGHPGGHPKGKPSAHAGGPPEGKLAEHPGGHPGGTPPGEGRPQHRGGPDYAWKYFPGMEIYEYTFATGQLKRLTSSDGYDAECTYCSDGRHIVFASLRDGDQEIYVCDADGGNPRRITHAPGGDGGPFFSPDGKRLVYRSDRCGNGNLQIVVNNVEGTAEKQLTTNCDEFHWCPYWHPSGRWIIFTHADFRGRPNFDLYVMRDDGSEMHRVTSDAAFDGLPVFSPDGRHLMWTSTRGGLDAPQVFIAEFIGLTPAGELRAGR